MVGGKVREEGWLRKVDLTWDSWGYASYNFGGNSE